jgi:hypothetical protein
LLLVAVSEEARMRILGIVFASILLTACKPTAAPPAPSGPPGHMEHQMGNCPAAVDGAVTAMARIEGGVSLDITAQDLGAAREIVARARHADDGPPDPAARPHTGEHGGSGDIGHCPIVHRGTTVTVTEIGGGVRVVVLATDPTQVDALVTETRARLRWLDPANHP